MGLTFFCDTSRRVFLLKNFNRFISEFFNIFVGNSTRRCHSQESVDDLFENSNSELRVNDTVSNVNVSDSDAHNNLPLLCDSGCGVVLGDGVPRLRVFFIDSRGGQRSEDSQNESAEKG